MNLAYKHDSPQGEVIEFPKHERQVMSSKIGGENVSYTKKPNLFFDEVMSQVSGNAYKCLDVIVRCTFGYHKDTAQISEHAFMSQTGIKRKETLRAAISELEKLKLIFVDRKSGVTNQFTLTHNQYDKSVPALENSPSTNNPSETSTNNPSETSTNNPSPNKENIKENFKENLCEENSVDSVLKLWVPKLEILNAWLQRAGIAKMTQAEAETWLLEINGYYSSKIEAGLLNDTQMYTNFVKWIKRSYSTRKPAPQQMDSRNVNAAWENINPDYSNAGDPVELEDWML
ncbi:TPA: replication protein [Acinetobacter nosocomialis]|uniref:replication protein n=1 Tax=Acinetobacter baumannii TaxID=470 RepID=UPI002AB4C53B|nr:replication protein [Acinetobacter nosocomialis]